MNNTDTVLDIVQLFNKLNSAEAQLEVIKILEKIAQGKEWKQ